MNPVLRNKVYGKGTQQQVDYMAKIGGMSELEKQVFQLLHEDKDAEYIKAELYIDRKKYDQLEDDVRTKLAIAVFECINNSIRESL